jgi:hypothetical protein
VRCLTDSTTVTWHTRETGIEQCVVSWLTCCEFRQLCGRRAAPPFAALFAPHSGWFYLYNDKYYTVVTCVNTSVHDDTGPTYIIVFVVKLFAHLRAPDVHRAILGHCRGVITARADSGRFQFRSHESCVYVPT